MDFGIGRHKKTGSNYGLFSEYFINQNINTVSSPNNRFVSIISTIFAESAVKCFAFHLNLQPSFEFKFRTPHVIDKIVTISYPPTKGPSTDKLTLTAQLP